MCEPDWKAGLLGTVLYVFWCISLLIVPRQADRFGRRYLFLVSRLIETGLYLAVLIVTDYWTMLGLMIALGLCAAGRVNVGTVYVTEWFPRKNHTVLHMLFAGEVALGYIGFALYFWFWGNDTMNVSILAYTLGAISVLLTLIVPESPRLLAAKGRVDEFQKALNRMAWINCRKIVWREEELRWIEENGQNKPGKNKSKPNSILRFINVDVAIARSYQLEITDLPADAD